MSGRSDRRAPRTGTSNDRSFSPAASSCSPARPALRFTRGPSRVLTMSETGGGASEGMNARRDDGGVGIDGVQLTPLQPISDDRGSVVELYRREWLRGASEMVQANMSRSNAGVLR